MLDEVGRFISTVGFPVAVASFFIFRMNGKLDKLTDALHKLADLIERQREESE